MALAAERSAGLNALSWRMMAKRSAVSMRGPIGE
jgi:hypothetical protein